MLASWRERGWLTLYLTTSLPSFCIVYCLSASFSFNKHKSAPHHHDFVPPFSPPPTTTWVLSENRTLTGIKRAVKHLWTRDTSAVMGEQWHTKAAAHDKVWCLYTLKKSHASTHTNSRWFNRTKKDADLWAYAYMHMHKKQVFNYMSARQSWHILASLKHTQTHRL